MNAARRPRPRSLPLKPLYCAADLEGLAHLDGLPGEAPFVRGPYPGMYTERPWTLRQYAGFASAAAPPAPAIVIGTLKSSGVTKSSWRQ